MSLSDITRHACALVESWAQQSLGLLDLRVIALLHQHPQGLRVEEIADRLTTNPRGVWRNLVVLMDKGVIARRFQERPAGTRGRAAARPFSTPSLPPRDLMRFLSICSGIEAASVAFHPLGWRALAFAEIEPFPCRLLAHHYPQVPNLGDLTRWREWSPELLAQADVLCGGTPCQAFSVAGLRGSLNDERGNLTLTFCHLYDEIDRQRHLCGRPPAVCLWENVPGVLNTNDNAFGHFLAGLAGEDVPLTPPGARWTDAGYVRGPRRAIAWRVLDAQYFGLAQRRERVFVVASADPAFDPAAVLFELDGLRRDTPPRRGAGEGAAPTLSARTKGGGGLGTDAECDGEKRRRGEEESFAFDLRGREGGAMPEGPHATANIRAGSGGSSRSYVAQKAEGEGQRAESPEAFAFHENQRGELTVNDTAGSLKVAGGKPGQGYPAVAFQERGRKDGPNLEYQTDLAYSLNAPNGGGRRQELNVTCQEPSALCPPLSASQWRVRRLTPEECEILQGFPVGYTLIPGTSSKKRKGEDLSDTIDYLISLGLPRPEAEVLAHSPDGPRYKALGNSWAVPVARWIARRIDAHLTRQTSNPGIP